MSPTVEEDGFSGGFVGGSGGGGFVGGGGDVKLGAFPAVIGIEIEGIVRAGMNGKGLQRLLGDDGAAVSGGGAREQKRDRHVGVIR